MSFLSSSQKGRSILTTSRSTLCDQGCDHCSIPLEQLARPGGSRPDITAVSHWNSSLGLVGAGQISLQYPTGTARWLGPASRPDTVARSQNQSCHAMESVNIPHGTMSPRQKLNVNTNCDFAAVRDTECKPTVQLPTVSRATPCTHCAMLCFKF